MDPIEIEPVNESNIQAVGKKLKSELGSERSLFVVSLYHPEQTTNLINCLQLFLTC